MSPTTSSPGSRAFTSESPYRFYLDAGAGEPAMVLLHGIPSHHVIWREVIAALPNGLRAIAPDLTGFGLSDLPDDADLSPDGQARDLLAFLEALGIERYGIVAHDYGALVACAMLAQAPARVTHLAITNTSLRYRDWSGEWPNPFQIVRLPLVGELAFALARRFMLKWAYALYVTERRKLDGPLMDVLWEPFEHGFGRTLLRVFREVRSEQRDFDRWREALAAFGGPALIAWGARDPTFRADRAIDIAELLPQAETFVLSGSNHFVQIDRPRALARLITRLAGGSGQAGGDRWQASS